MHELSGCCHCGNISVFYKTNCAPEDAAPRACQCSFCRKHQSSAVSDNDGDLTIHVKDGDQLSRYQFGLKTCDFLVCRTCGVYVAAFVGEPDDSQGFATLMSHVLEDRTRYKPAEPTSYAAENAEGRRARRRKVWTPARLEIG